MLHTNCVVNNLKNKLKIFNIAKYLGNKKLNLSTLKCLKPK
jgi:hypothetical protein